MVRDKCQGAGGGVKGAWELGEPLRLSCARGPTGGQAGAGSRLAQASTWCWPAPAPRCLQKKVAPNTARESRVELVRFLQVGVPGGRASCGQPQQSASCSPSEGQPTWADAELEGSCPGSRSAPAPWSPAPSLAGESRPGGPGALRELSPEAGARGHESRNHSPLFGTYSLGGREPCWSLDRCTDCSLARCVLRGGRRNVRYSLWPHACWGRSGAARATWPYGSRASKGSFENAGICGVLLSHFPVVGAGAWIPGRLWPAAGAWSSSLHPPLFPPRIWDPGASPQAPPWAPGMVPRAGREQAHTSPTPRAGV